MRPRKLPLLTAPENAVRAPPGRAMLVAEHSGFARGAAHTDVVANLIREVFRHRSAPSSIGLQRRRSSKPLRALGRHLRKSLDEKRVERIALEQLLGRDDRFDVLAELAQHQELGEQGQADHR